MQKHKAILSLVFLIGALSANISWADTFYLYNGQVLQGKIIDVVGELLHFQSDFWNATQINRIELLNKHDEVQLISGKKIDGEVIYVDPFKLEIVTDQGRKYIWRLLIRNINFGQPVVTSPPAQPPLSAP